MRPALERVWREILLTQIVNRMQLVVEDLADEAD